MLKIRLRRMGSRHAPFYRVVVSDGRNTPKAAAVEEIGFYDPRQDPVVISIDEKRVEYWRSHGARLSDTVAQLVERAQAAPADAKAAEAQEPAKAAQEPAKAAQEPAKAAQEPAKAAQEPAEAVQETAEA